MVENNTRPEHRERTPVLLVIGVVLLLLGTTAAVFSVSLLLHWHWKGRPSGPSVFRYLEWCMITGCCLFAAILTPLGYGHMKARRWARTLSITVLHVWLVLGALLTLLLVFRQLFPLPVMVLAIVVVSFFTFDLFVGPASSGSRATVILFMPPVILLAFLAVAYLSPAKGPASTLLLLPASGPAGMLLTDVFRLVAPFSYILGALMALAWPVVPWLLIRFYESRNVVQMFDMKDARTYWTDRVPVPILVLSSLYVFYVIAVPFPMMLNGVFPVFGVLISGLQGKIVLGASALPFAVLAWGTLRRRIWAWWAALVCVGALLVSSTLTLPRLSYSGILETMNLRPADAQTLQRLSFEGIHFAAFVGAPLLIIVAKIILARKHFRAGNAVGTT
jgi:hypothetical protein